MIFSQVQVFLLKPFIPILFRVASILDGFISEDKKVVLSGLLKFLYKCIESRS